MTDVRVVVADDDVDLRDGIVVLRGSVAAGERDRVPARVGTDVDR